MPTGYACGSPSVGTGGCAVEGPAPRARRPVGCTVRAGSALVWVGGMRSAASSGRGGGGSSGARAARLGPGPRGRRSGTR